MLDIMRIQRDKTKIKTQGKPECIQTKEHTIFPFPISVSVSVCRLLRFFKGEMVHPFKEKGGHKNHGWNNRDKVAGRSVGHEHEKKGVGKKKEKKPDLRKVGPMF